MIYLSHSKQNPIASIDNLRINVYFAFLHASPSRLQGFKCILIISHSLFVSNQECTTLSKHCLLFELLYIIAICHYHY